MSLEIRPFTIDDYDEAFELWRGAEGVGLRGSADSREGIARYLQRNQGSSFVARQGGTLVGAVLCGHDGRRGFLHHLAVAESHRQRGIGAALARKCLASLREAGIPRCLLFVHAGNEGAQEFWSHEGWSLRGDVEMMSVDLEATPGDDRP